MDIETAFQAQSAHKWVLRKSAAADRVARLRSLREAIEDREDDVKRALHLDLGKSPEHAQIELDCSYADIDYAIGHLAEWMVPRRQALTALPAGTSEIRIQSRGQVMLFGAWNFPFNLVVQPLVPAIAAGNCVVVKPNEISPATSRVLAEILRDVFPSEEVAVFEGGVELAQELLTFPFDHIFLTGSPAVGRAVMNAASNHLASVTLELGGKNPVIIDGSYPLEAAAAAIIQVRLMNHGQICLAPENVWIPADRVEEFIKSAKKAIEAQVYVDGKIDPSRTGRIVNDQNLDRIAAYLDDAVVKGARLHCGGQVHRDERIIEPAILSHIPSEAMIAQEEIFGPVLCVHPYREISDAFAALQAEPVPLAMYLFSNDSSFVSDVIENTRSGGVTVNSCLAHFLEHDLPFGGAGASGIGAYHGERGFLELSHQRALFVLPRSSAS